MASELPTAAHHDGKKRLLVYGGVALLGLIVFLYVRSHASSTSTTTSGLDTSEVDPSTGMTYGEEIADAETGADGTTSDSSGLDEGGDSGSTGTAGATASALDPTATDPDTGLTYGQELAAGVAAELAPAPAAPATSTSPDTSDQQPIEITEPTITVNVPPATPVADVPAPTQTPAAAGGAAGSDAAVVTASAPATKTAATADKVTTLASGAKVTTLPTGEEIEQAPGKTPYVIKKAS